MPERETALTAEDPVKKGAVTALRERARRSRIAAMVVLVLVIISLVSGLGFFVFAGAIASREVRPAAQADYIDLNEEFMRSRGLHMASPAVFSSTSPPGPISAISGEPGGIGSLTDKQRDEIISKVNKLNEQNQSLWQAVQAFVSNSLATREAVASLSTRVGSIFILLFLVQILVSLYRYNIRLASYYDARADALQLASDTRSEEFFKLVLILSPEHLEFGRFRTPLNELAKYVREYTSGGKEKKEG
jgi:hypothetical protein